MLTIHAVRAEKTLLAVPPTRELLISWNTREPSGSLEILCRRSDGKVSAPLPYVTFSPYERRSHSGRDDLAHIDIDILRSPLPIIGVEVRSTVPLDAVAVCAASADAKSPSPPQAPILLDVPMKSQYVADLPGERGWCSPAATAMVLAYWGIDLTVPETVVRTHDAAYQGTGNWTFNTALAGAVGLRGAVCRLRHLAHAASFLRSGIPLVLSIAWSPGALPGAPIAESRGHLLVLRGFDHAGNPLCNDPAHPAILTTYPREAFERAWRAHGGIVYLIAPAERTEELVHLANAHT